MLCFICLCHVLYIFAMFYLFMSLSCCITIHLCCTKISIFVVLFSLIYVASKQIHVASTQQLYVASRFVSSSIFSIIPYSEKISSPALFCGPLYPTRAEITRHNNSKWCVNQLSIFLHIVTWDYVAQSCSDCVWLEIWRSWVQSLEVYWLSVRTPFVRPWFDPNAACTQQGTQLLVAQPVRSWALNTGGPVYVP